MSTLRISGLASGMDIDSMVTKLMTAERIPLDKLKQKKQVLEWQRDDYRSMNTLLLDFRTQLTNMKLTTNYRARTATSSSDTLVSATASSAASQATYTISEVSQLASAATKVSTAPISQSTISKIDPSKSLFDGRSSFANGWTWQEGSVETKTFSPSTETNTLSLGLAGGVTIQPSELSNTKVTVDGTSYKVVTGVIDPTTLADDQVSVDTAGNLLFKNNIKMTSTIKVDYVANKKIESISAPDDSGAIQLVKGSIKTVNSLVIGGSSYSVDASGNVTDSSNVAAGTLDLNTGKLTMNGSNPVTKGTTVNIDYTQNYFDIGMTSHTSTGTKSENFAIQGTETLNNVISKINSSTLGVTMFYDDMSDKLTLTRNETGNFNGKDSLDPTRTSADDEITTTSDFLNNTLQFGSATETGGDNAKFTVNGLTTERYTNTFQMSGVTFTLKQEFSNTNVSVSIGNDSTKVYDNIKGFVDKYNELIGKIQSKISEDYYRDYPPLTDDQKQQLSETQQDQWTAKAKSGLLRNDTTLSSVLDRMRSNLYSPVTNSQVNSAYKQLASIGITTTANYLEGGKLTINDAKLKAAIEADPESVENLFRGTGTTSSEQGVIQRLYDTVNNTMDSLKTKAGNTYSTNKQFAIGMQLDTVNSQITSFEDRMKQVENRYYNQFTAMEQAIQKANSQSTYLMQQFSSGQ